ncbi:39S ribosomal protein L3, mitochondrial-like [Oppia nitens]|uniref:39S ribosomal protein L3, mitochondrial-like n=1 Tax=Oppia nitens TaxID=1686743 RepID=UPI0023D9AA0C|nr:39S ribosomal protein L3, mitochondrial-like [Oppia nitens]
MSLFSSVLGLNSQLIRNVWQITRQTYLLPSMVTIEQKRNAFKNAKTVKRRKTHPFHWWPRVRRRTDFPFKTNITHENQKFVDEYIKDKYGIDSTESPLKGIDLKREEWTEESQRCGVIARKIGHYPMWTKSGKRLLTTVVQIVDNHVIKYYSPEEWEQNSRSFYKYHRNFGMGVCIVGAESTDPRNFTAAYRGLFTEAGVMPKSRLSRFFVTPNAKLAPGTSLTAMHYRVGDYVDVWGKTIDRGFQGVIVRWGFKGQDKYRGVTKAHRRIGSIGRSRKLMVLKGRKMPGHMGNERRVLKGLKIWRINTKHNVIWIHGPAIPGPCHGWVYLYDSRIPDKELTAENSPPFPTYYAEHSNEELPEDLYDKDLQSFDSPTIIFEETEAERKAALAAAKATKKAKIAKIR